jgi:hypothetical protein
MARHVKIWEKWKLVGTSLEDKSPRVLDIADIGNEAGTRSKKVNSVSRTVYAAVDYMATAAIASKLPVPLSPKPGRCCTRRSDYVWTGFSRSLSHRDESTTLAHNFYNYAS